MSLSEDEANLSVFCATFNTACASTGQLDPPDLERLTDLLQRHAPHTDVFAIGFQEVSSRLDKYLWDSFVSGQDQWTELVSLILYPHGYKRLRSIRVLGIVLDIFVHQDHLLHVRDLQTNYIRLSVGGYLGFKGAVSVRFRIYGVSLCFVNSHLTAHDQYLNYRVQEYNKIVEGIKFDNEDAPSILFHDYIIWVGDLNFRLLQDSFNFEDINLKVQKGELEDLLAKDQLADVMKREVAFHELEENSITFSPTYKYKIGCNEYDPKRRPAWTDRILFRCNRYNYDHFNLRLNQKTYEAHPEITCSDHKPVTSQFDLVRFSAQGAQKRDVPVFDPIITFHTPDDWQVGKDGLITYFIEVGKSHYVSSWDWIALFRSNFLSLEDYITFTWASPSRLTTEQKTAIIMDSAIVAPGKFVLFYFDKSNGILGKSNEFIISLPPDRVPPIELAQEALE